MNPNEIQSDESADRLRRDLSRPDAYPDEIDAVEHLETHISHVFLAGHFAYKIKKSIRTPFLDYSTLEKRKEFCEKELELNRRFAPQLYLDVVPVILQRNRLVIPESSRQDEFVVDYAVKMRRFASNSLLTSRIQSPGLSRQDAVRLARCVAMFHEKAEPASRQHSLGTPELIWSYAEANWKYLEQHAPTEHLKRIRAWSESEYASLKQTFTARRSEGFVRACHGDLHLANVVDWNGEMTPFDGIEFNEELRWIDVLSDAAFLFMDFFAQGHPDLAYYFLNEYMQLSGDYAHLSVFRWYTVYRAMVRAMVAGMRATQPDLSEAEAQEIFADGQSHVELACHLAESAKPPQLFITHGLSGSGKSYGTESMIGSHQAIRLRSDVVRRRIFEQGEKANGSTLDDSCYSTQAIARVYARLHQLAERVLAAGYSVIVDATFLYRSDRNCFQQLAEKYGTTATILSFQVDQETLRTRISKRKAEGEDPSDADLSVLEKQLKLVEPLAADELARTVQVHG